MSHRWDELAGQLDYAFQPIVNVHSGHCFGYEALLRGHEALGFATPRALFDQAIVESGLPAVELLLRGKALSKFAAIAGDGAPRLFFNVDIRLIGASGYRARDLAALSDRLGLPRGAICLELSEDQQVLEPPTAQALGHFRAEGFAIALDDFGIGGSSLKLLHDYRPNFIKIDRFFIAGIDLDYRKKVLVGSMVNIAHALGITVLAEGVETPDELTTCRSLGCELVQGYLIAPPTTDITELARRYPLPVLGMAADGARRVSDDRELVTSSIELIEPLVVTTPMDVVFDRFRHDKSHSVVPVVDGAGRALGLVRERDLKDYVYSPFGKDLLTSRVAGRGLQALVSACPIVDIHTRAEQIIEIFSGDDNEDGLLITQADHYAGFLSASALVRIVHEKHLSVARDQNPLTKLPGNNSIVDYVSAALGDTGRPYVLVYFDFDNFKPFNDTLGFRMGDRAILMFAEILTGAVAGREAFVGHVGGDDFFVGLTDASEADAQPVLAEIMQKFAGDAVSLYDPASREAGFITAKDRDGRSRRFPLLSVSGVAVWLPAGRRLETVEHVTRLIADSKGKAKAAPERLSRVSIAA